MRFPCNACRVVLDVNVEDLLNDIRYDDGSIDTTQALWTGENWVPLFKCPVCGHETIIEEN